MRRLAKQFLGTPLFVRMLLLLTLSVSLPVATLGLISYERSKNQVEEVANVFLADNVAQNVHRVERFLKEAEHRSEAALASQDLQDLLKSASPRLVTDEIAFIQRMNTLISELKGPFELYVFPINYDEYPNYRNLLQYRQVEPTEEMFASAALLEGGGYWMHEWNRQWQAPDFMFVRQIRSLDRFRPLGLIVVRVPDFMIREELIGPALYPRAELVMTDKEGAVLSHSDAAQYGAPSELARNGESYVHASLSLTAGEWKLSILLPKEDITATLEEVKRDTVWVVLASLILITALLFLIARSFTNPIKQIISYMKKVRLGQLKRMPVQERHDEIGQWMSGYNAMIESLLEQMETIRGMERESNDLERQMLMLQINPHFLYNTLDSIKWKAQAIDEPVISDMVTRLAAMLRFSLSEGNGWTTLERELAHVKNYVEIERLRNPGQFKVLYHVPAELLGERMLQLVLQPIVENAIRHGINKRKEGGGKIIVSAYKDQNDIVFSVEDNGPALPSAGNGGIGLSNVERRLTLHFGEGERVVAEPANGGFKTTIVHPVARQAR